MMTPTSSRAMAASPWYHACCSWRKWSPTATTPSEPKTIADSRVGDAGGSEDTSVSTPKARYGRGSSPCSSRAIDDFPELEAPLRTITALRTPTTVAQRGPCPRANCFPAGPTAHGHARSCADLAQTWFSSFRNGIPDPDEGELSERAFCGIRPRVHAGTAWWVFTGTSALIDVPNGATKLHATPSRHRDRACQAAEVGAVWGCWAMTVCSDGMRIHRIG